MESSRQAMKSRLRQSSSLSPGRDPSTLHPPLRRPLFSSPSTTIDDYAQMDPQVQSNILPGENLSHQMAPTVGPEQTEGPLHLQRTTQRELTPPLVVDRGKQRRELEALGRTTAITKKSSPGGTTAKNKNNP